MFKLQILNLVGKNTKKAEMIRQSGLFKHFGSGGYWHPTTIPSHPDMISIGNEVVVAADVKFYEHDLTYMVLNAASNTNDYKYYKGSIVVGDNVMIGANSIILYNIQIGNNVIIAAGSVVTKDIPDNTIVGGNPARIIGEFNKLLEKRK